MSPWSIALRVLAAVSLQVGAILLFYEFHGIAGYCFSLLGWAKDDLGYCFLGLFWLFSPAVPLAQHGVPYAGILMGALLLAWGVFLAYAGGVRRQRRRAWVRLVAWNVLGWWAVCLVTFAIFIRFPTPKPLLTRYDDLPESRATYVAWFDLGYRSGAHGSREIVCILGWSDPQERGYASGYRVGWQVMKSLFGLRIAVPERLQSALSLGDLAEANRLVAATKTAVNERDRSGNSLLHVACRSGLDVPELVSKLIARGAEVTATNLSGATPMYLASGFGRLSVVRVLQAARANVQTATLSGSTPLHGAAGSDSSDSAGIVEFLIQHGASVEAKDRYGGTPLVSSVYGGNPKTARVLISHGVNINATNSTGTRVLQMALEGGYGGGLSIARLLLDHGVDLTFLESLKAKEKSSLQQAIDRECKAPVQK